jgi:hypothetical protein
MDLMNVLEFMEHREFKINTEYVKLFWDAISNEEWMYLSDEIIMSYMTNEKGSDAVKQFIRRKLLECDDYKENIDYKNITKNDDLVKNNIFKKTSNRKKYYAVTGKCFKTLLLKSNTLKSNSIREYYINLEELYIQYMKYQCGFYKTNYCDKVNDLTSQLHNVKYTREIKIKELEQTLNERYKIGCVYYIKSGEYTKIGYTFNLPERLKSLQTANPIKLIVEKTALYQFPHIAEAELHKKYKKYHVQGEWFKFC